MIDFEEIIKLGVLNNLDIFNIEEPFILYGVGLLGKMLYEQLKKHNKNVVAVCDGNSSKIGQEFYDVKVQRIEDVIGQYSEYKVIIASNDFYQAIKEKLEPIVGKARILPELPHGIVQQDMIENNKEKLNWIYNNLADEKSKETFINILKGKVSGNVQYYIDSFVGDQYFVDGVVKLSDNEVFLNAGGFTGETVVEFCKRTNNKYEKIYSFEPFFDSFQQLKSTKENILNNDQRIEIFQYGLYDCKKEIGMGYTNNSDIGGSTAIIGSMSEVNVSESIQTVAVDEFINGRLSFIELDIEGSELAALKGARQTILKYRPKLSICVYHKQYDIIEIPEFIMNLGLGYKYYLRHHISPEYEAETVFYAV